MLIRAISIILVALVHPAAAQGFIEQNRCWLGSKSFSEGATVAATGAVMMCSEDFRWITTTQRAAGCLYNDAFYGVGAVVIDGWADSNIRQACQSDGTWELLD